jgi:CubicO group peptidase (beta-lactamase class C family)
VTEDAIFGILSMTNPLVSVDAMILLADDACELADPVSKHPPEFSDMGVSTAPTDVLRRRTYDRAPLRDVMTVQDLRRRTARLAYGELTGDRDVRVSRRPSLSQRRGVLMVEPPRERPSAWPYRPLLPLRRAGASAW